VVNASAETAGVSLSTGFNPGYSVTSVSGHFLIDAYRIEKVKFTGGSGNDSINTGAGALTVDGGAGLDFWQADYSEAISNLTFADDVPECRWIVIDPGHRADQPHHRARQRYDHWRCAP
jgi:hypothetical protein